MESPLTHTGDKMSYIIMYLTVILLTAITDMLQRTVATQSELGNTNLVEAILPAMWIVTIATIIMYVVAGLFTIRLINKNF